LNEDIEQLKAIHEKLAEVAKTLGCELEWHFHEPSQTVFFVPKLPAP